MTEPKSIRLTNAHRTDIIDSVMKQWVEKNKKPEEATVLDLFKAMHVKYTGDLNLLPKEDHEYAKAMEASKNIMALIKSSNVREADILKTVQMASVISIKSVGNKGSSNENRVRIPVEVADELGIPHLVYTSTYSLNSEEASYYNDYATSTDNHRGYIELADIPSPYHSITLVHNKDCDVYQAYLEKRKALKAWEKQRDSIREEFVDYLNQFNTTKQIRDGWPELEQYLPAHLADPEKVIQLPALTRSRLNERLGI